MTIRTCAECGKEFKIKYWNQKYCTKKCFYRHQRKKYLCKLKKRYKNDKEYREYIRTKSNNWKKNNREKVQKLEKKRRNERKTEIDRILGVKCVICGSTEKLINHQIYGEFHNYYEGYILKHAKDFTRLCFKCHKMIHHLAKQTNIPINILLIELMKITHMHK